MYCSRILKPNLLQCRVRSAAQLFSKSIVSSSRSCAGVGSKLVYKDVTPPGKQSNVNKVTVVGAGSVGIATAFSLITRNVCSELCVTDLNEKLTQGEKMDLVQGLPMIQRRVTINAGSDYALTKGSQVVVVTAGARQAVGESRLQLVSKNVAIFKTMIPQLLKYSPDATIIIVTNPCEVMAWVAWKLSKVPLNKIFSAGTMLDTSRFRHFLGEKLGVASQNVHGYIVGEHGDSSVPLWSSVSVGGNRLKDLAPDVGQPGDSENFDQVRKDVVAAAYEIIKLKGYTNWAIGLMASKLCEIIMQNQQTIVPVGTIPKGWNGINDELFLSLPCVLGQNGIEKIVNLKIDPGEMKKLEESAAVMKKVISDIKL